MYTNEQILDNYEINIHPEWYSFIVDDYFTILKQIGFYTLDNDNHLYFSLDRDYHCYISGNFHYHWQKDCLKNIKKNYPLATELHEIVALLVKLQRKYFYQLHLTISFSHSQQANVTYGGYRCDEKHFYYKQIEDDFNDILRWLNQWCLSNLNKEYDYLTSEEAIIESMQANGIPEYEEIEEVY